MDALVRFYEGEWAYLAKAEYCLQSAMFQGGSRVREHDDSS
jgi:hypothetical protein